MRKAKILYFFPESILCLEEAEKYLSVLMRKAQL